jgi:hypothetical protein
MSYGSYRKILPDIVDCLSFKYICSRFSNFVVILNFGMALNREESGADARVKLQMAWK